MRACISFIFKHTQRTNNVDDSLHFYLNCAYNVGTRTSSLKHTHTQLHIYTQLCTSFDAQTMFADTCVQTGAQTLPRLPDASMVMNVTRTKTITDQSFNSPRQRRHQKIMQNLPLPAHYADESEIFSCYLS